MKNQQCEGCRSSYILDDGYYCIIFIEDPKNCPCSECLIKTMCSKQCDEIKSRMYVETWETTHDSKD